MKPFLFRKFQLFHCYCGFFFLFGLSFLFSEQPKLTVFLSSPQTQAAEKNKAKLNAIELNAANANVSDLNGTNLNVSDSEAADFDVVVYGGTCASVISAVQVKKMGKTVVIVSPDKHLGGLSSGGLGATDSGNRSVIGGLSREFYHRLWTYYQQESVWTFQDMPKANGIPGQGGRGIDNSSKTMWVFEPHVAEKIFDDFVREYQIPVFKEERLDRENGVLKEGTRILSIKTLSGKTFSGKMFLDTTYEGDLMAAAGVSYTVGRESNKQYNETLNGIQRKNAVYHQFSGTVDPYIEKGKPESGLLPGVFPANASQNNQNNQNNKDNKSDQKGQADQIGQKNEDEDGQADNKLQAYCLRMCLTNDPRNLVPITKPENYRESDYELLFRSIEAGQKSFMTFSPMPNHKTDSNNNLAVSTDFIGQNYDYPDADYERREEIYLAHRNWQQGLLWTLQNHDRVPEKIRQEISVWGLAKDEFIDNDNWSHQLYIREARRLIGDFVVSERHLRYWDPTPRPIGMGSYNMDSHHVQRYVGSDKNGNPTVLNEGDVQINPGAPYPIDFGSVLPKKEECSNLLVPVCVSCSHIAYGSIRMEPVFMILGQSAATAAVLSIEENIAPADLDYSLLSQHLIADGQILKKPTNISALDSTPREEIDPKTLQGTVVDNSDAVLTGDWTSGNVIDPFVGKNYLHDGNDKSVEKKAVFFVSVPKPGKYECRIAYPVNPNRATNVPVSVKTDTSSVDIFLNQQRKTEIDGLFSVVGTVEFRESLKATVSISNKETNGFVLIDAVQFVPTSPAQK